MRTISPLPFLLHHVPDWDWNPNADWDGIDFDCGPEVHSDSVPDDDPCCCNDDCTP